MKRVLWLLSMFILVHIPIKLYAAEAVPTVRSTAYESSHLLTTSSSKSLYWITVTWNNASADRWLIVYDATVVPVDGPLTPAKILYCAVMSLSTDPQIGTRSFDWTNHPLYRGTTGMVVFVSTSSDGCITKAADDDNDWFTAGIN